MSKEIELESGRPCLGHIDDNLFRGTSQTLLKGRTFCRTLRRSVIFKHSDQGQNLRKMACEWTIINRVERFPGHPYLYTPSKKLTHSFAVVLYAM